MKFLIMFLFSLLAFNVFSAEVGENPKSECPYAVQTAKREAKVVPTVEEIKEGAKSANIGK
jgi:hypothetical protein